jgi:nicotinate-nucleotide pyrophosphorylase (carboxylating)
MAAPVEFSRVAPGLLPASKLEALARSWIDEDIPGFDVGGAVVADAAAPDEVAEATLWQKADGVLAGVPFFDAVFAVVGCTVTWEIPEGAHTKAGEGADRVRVATVRGPPAAILQGERSALNMLARAAGVATVAWRAAELKRKSAFTGSVAGTRKTTPGFRLVEKYAMLVGGADQHRYDLSSMTMLKDNHIWSCGSIAKAVSKARSFGGFAVKIEVECQSLETAKLACDAGADVVMLDNFTPAELKTVAAAVKEYNSHVLVEASGGITLETLDSYFSEHIDVISMGCMTQSVPHIDFSLKLPLQKLDS